MWGRSILSGRKQAVGLLAAGLAGWLWDILYIPALSKLYTFLFEQTFNNDGVSLFG